MALKAEQLKAELTEQIVRRVRDRLDRDKASAAECFVRDFYANVPPDDILRASPDTLYGAALALWQFIAERPARTAHVRAYHPRIERHGWQSDHSVVEINTDDMPFLVDSVTAELNRLGLAVHLVIHPVIRVRRDAKGHLLDLCEPGEAASDAPPESVMHIEIDQQTSPEALEAVRAGIEAVLGDVRRAVEDWQSMREKAAEIVAEVAARPTDGDEVPESLAFLRWLDDANFTYLGYRAYEFGRHGEDVGAALVPGSGLGVLRDDAVSVFEGLRNFATLPPDVRDFLREPRLLMVTKTNRRATVHRPTPMDSMLVKTYDAEGQVVGARVFVGLFTSVAYSRSARDIPFLRRKVDHVLARAGFDPRSHDGKALTHILETFPRDELFQIDETALFDIAMGVLHLQERQRIALFVRKDPFERFVSCLFYVPRDRYDTSLRRRAQAILEAAFDGTCANFATQLDESALARVHFIIRIERGSIPEHDVHAIEAQLIETSRAWADRIQQALIEAEGEERGLRLARRYAAAFPTSYVERFAVQAAVYDVARIEEVVRSGRLGMSLYRPIEAAGNELRFKIFHDRPLALSDVLPMLEHMDLRVITEVAFAVKLADRASPMWLHDFEMTTRSGLAVDLADRQDAFQEAFSRIWSGELEDDGLNRLVLLAGLDWREVVVLRVYARFLRQARFAFSPEIIESTLAAHAVITRLIVRLFLALHDPARHDEGEVAARGLLLEIEHALDAVENLDEDRILRRFVNLVRATLRTNYFQPAADKTAKPYLAFKLDSRAIEELPLPRPLVEIFVYSTRVEAVHLRGGKVARGGIRWSDRREDFRTEILGLMKAQMVKNAVIVPVGSKGGFVVKRPPAAEAGREALMAEVVECYKTLMRGMLDMTDNFVGGAVVPPPEVVRRDGDDPYLVVAADKGTATFSDIANGVSKEYGFWLGDAFASGGSAGYDHKKMGITARGAWESVKRHFREIGVDVQAEEVTAVGVGDMAGDVFGNGMLQSRYIRLIGAFNHQHVFCDPNPDAAASFAERKRLFELPRSSWADYDRALISEGGGVFDRKAKSVAVTPQIRARLGIVAERVTPSELIQAMLRAPVDLLWFGGIGTFVKASFESHADAGDKASDALRVSANELHAKVIGEGANLAVTQRGRIEFARHGGRLNTDAIDNSAGVDTSDHEVNIKILLGDVVDSGDMTVKQRDRLLAGMTDEVALLVLADNYLQTQAISMIEARGADLLDRQARCMQALEKRGQLDRAIELLPDDEELASRAVAKAGLTRPEIAVLLAYAKITLYEDLLASRLPDDPRMVDDLVAYFPTALHERHRPAIERHRLRREIIATYATNDLVNRLGPSFVLEMVDKTGAAPGEVAAAYTVVREAFGLPALWRAIEALDTKVPASCQTAMLWITHGLVERNVAWFLANASQPIDVAAETAAYRTGIEALAESLETVLSEDELRQWAEHTAALVREGVPKDLARRLASLPVLEAATDVTRIARRSGNAVPDVAAVYYALGDRFGTEWLREQAHVMKADTGWQKQAIEAIVDDLFTLQAELAAGVLDGLGDESAAADGAAIDHWVEARRPGVERAERLVAELRGQPSVDLAMLAVASRRLRTLVAE